MRLGQLSETKTETGVQISGRIVSYSMDLFFKLSANMDRRDDKSPTHMIYAKGVHGTLFHAGAAWQGKTKDGEIMYSLAFSIPELFEKEMRYMAWFESLEEHSCNYRIEENKPAEAQRAAA